MFNPIQGLPRPTFDTATSSDTGLQPNASDSQFMDTFKSAMDEISTMQGQADDKVTQLLSGNGQDIHSAMIAVEKANLSFQMMVQVRNKIVQAYQQIASMPF
ncbi:MAG TPA: flagellar hook-basal body complex protein FliE [Candidatus Acidoferrum sp.]|nr:flagellar hook-basal body complex protein FliE [Candidatus Acidoferrum sp.]